MRNLISRLSVFLLLFVLLGCSKFQRVMKSDSVDEKYAAAVAYYEDKDYYRAGLLLEELVPLMRGREEAEKAQFYYAYAHFHQHQYLLSAYYFKTFYETYPRSQFAEEAQYMYGRSLFMDSPNYNLDQTSTVSAMEAIQTYLDRYPQSTRSGKADSMYTDLSEKLERKAFDNAKLYHEVRQYKSAVVALNNFQRDFPASRYGEEIAWLKLSSQFYLARQSVPEKQLERFDEVVDFYHQFLDKYPQSKFLKGAEALYDLAVGQVQRLKAAPATSNSQPVTNNQ